MPIYNSVSNFGSVAKWFHWTIAIAIGANVVIGLLAVDAPLGSDEALTFKAMLYSAHKTLGLVIFALALARIVWAISQVSPTPLAAEKPLEVFLSQVAHWTIYFCLVVVPLSGWLHHAATTGFAPIWWPFGQSLPFVAKDDALARVFSSIHIVALIVLGLTLVAHIAGALKHHFVDRDLTLRRMLPGQVPPTETPTSRSRWRPGLAAVGVFAVAFGIAGQLGAFNARAPEIEAVSLEKVRSGWEVQNGTIEISVIEMGSTTAGVFETWAAKIEFDPVAQGGKFGSVDVEIAIGSLTLGSVTSVALSPDFFDAAKFPTANFAGPIVEDGDNYAVDGNLTIKGVSVPIRLPFTLKLEDDVASVTANTKVDRRDMAVGVAYKDEEKVAFGIDLKIELTAQRAN